MRIVERVTTVDEDEDETVDEVHVHPTTGKEHELSRDCWCSPTIDSVYMGPGVAEIWVHRTIN